MAKRKEYKLQDVPTTEEVQLFLSYFNKDTITGYRNYTLFYTLAKTGMRVSELLNCRYEDIKEYKVSPTETAYYYRLQAKNAKNRRSEDKVIPSDVYKMFIEISKKFKHRQLGYVFTTVSKRDEKGKLKQLSYRAVAEVAEVVSKRLEIHPKIHPHSFRHYVGTTIYEKTGDIMLVKSALGHKSMNSSLVYTHIRPEAVRKATELIQF